VPQGRDWRRSVSRNPRSVPRSIFSIAHGPTSRPTFFDKTGRFNRWASPFPKLEIRIDEPDYTAIINEGQPVLGLNEIAELQQLAEAPAERLALALDSVRNNTSLVIVFRFQGQPCYFLGTLSGATGNLGSARTAPNSC
jgi:hypothetical protein